MVLHVTVAIHVRLVPRDVGVAEQDEIGVREPPPQSLRSAGGRTAVVYHRYVPPADPPLEPLGQIETVIVVTQHGVHGRDRGELIEHRDVGDVARMQDHVDAVDERAQPVEQTHRLAVAEMRVGDREGTGRAVDSIAQPKAFTTASPRGDSR